MPRSKQFDITPYPFLYQKGKGDHHIYCRLIEENPLNCTKCTAPDCYCSGNPKSAETKFNQQFVYYAAQSFSDMGVMK